MEFVEAGVCRVFDGGSKVDFIDSSPMKCGHAHWAGFTSRRNDGTFEVNLTDFCTPGSERVDFRVGRDVCVQDYRVVGARN